MLSSSFYNIFFFFSFFYSFIRFIFCFASYFKLKYARFLNFSFILLLFQLRFLYSTLFCLHFVSLLKLFVSYLFLAPFLSIPRKINEIIELWMDNIFSEIISVQFQHQPKFQLIEHENDSIMFEICALFSINQTLVDV